MISSITNGYPGNFGNLLPVERVTIYRPESELDWTYSHHAHITFFRDRFYAMWSNSRKNEDDLGQRVVYSTSTDFYHWTKSEPLVDTKWGKHSELVLTAGGFHQYGGMLVAYVGQYEYDINMIADGYRRSNSDAGHRDTRLFAVATFDGMDWSEPSDTGLALVPNHGPQRTATGRLVICGNVSFPYTDDPTGRSGWTQTGIYPKELGKEVVDDSESIHVIKEKLGWPVILCEGAFFQTDDQIIHMLLRSSNFKLWVTESRDDGASWIVPKETGFTDSNTKFQFGRLPDGRFYYVGSPIPDGKRNPLVLSISEDGVSFDCHYILCNERCEGRFEGLHKGGDFGYPHTLLHEGYLYVIFSVVKEEVQVIRVSLNAL